MFRSGGGEMTAKRKPFAAGRWAMLGLLGAGAATLAAQQSRRRISRKTRLDSVLEGAGGALNAPETPAHYVEAPGGAGRTQTEPAEDARAAPEAGSKMADAAPTRERDFGAAPQNKPPHRKKSEPQIVDQHQMEPDAIAAGGDIGELEGDKQSFGEVPTIIDQNKSAPAL